MATTKPIDTSSPVSDSPIVDDKSEKAELKKQAFDKEFRSFIKQAQETITARYGASIEFGSGRPELICLNRYLSIYNTMNAPEEHYRYFETLFNRKRSDILNCLKDDRWIRTGNIVIQFGEGVRASREMEEKRKQVRIMLSDIFLIACDLQSQAEKLLDGIDESFAKDAGGKDLIRPNILLLHLMRIFYHLTDGADKTQLGAIVTQLEDDLGVQKKTVSSADVKPASSESIGSLNTGGLSGIFNMATTMMQKAGFNPPPGMKPPSDNEISAVISSVFSNETTQNAIQTMFSSLQGCNDFGSAVQEVVKNVTDPKTMEAIQGSVMQTAQLAMANPSDSVDNPSDSVANPVVDSLI